MLAQNFKSAVDLGITDPQLSALQKTLVLLETGKLKHVHLDDSTDDKAPIFSGGFNMVNYHSKHDCGTVACIAGTAMLIGNVDFIECDLPHGLQDLFLPFKVIKLWSGITTAEAATALRSYLTTGDPHWDLAVA